MFKCQYPGCEKEFEHAIALKGHEKTHTKNHPKGYTKEIKIFSQEGEPDQVQLAMHGKDTPNTGWQIQRNVWVAVPDEVITILNDAVIETMAFDPDPNVPGKYTRRPIQEQRYPFAVRDIRR